jgi:TRAP-type mannitol/chloroaromatic compound transport system substrate-binding protein
VNSSAWEKLPPEYKAAFEAACAEAGTMMLARYDAQNPAALGRLVAAGAQVRLFPQEIMAAAFKESEALMEELGDKNPTFKELLANYRAFRKEEYRWFSIAETRFDTFMISALR